jgi:hypothetical protein
VGHQHHRVCLAGIRRLPGVDQPELPEALTREVLVQQRVELGEERDERLGGVIAALLALCGHGGDADHG